MLRFLKSIFTILQFILLTYLYLVVTGLRQIFEHRSIFRRILAATAVVFLIGFPIWAFRSFFATPQPTIIGHPGRVVGEQPSLGSLHPASTMGTWQITPLFNLPSHPSNARPFTATASIVNGDTLDVASTSFSGRIRLIGIDTPEDGMCYGTQASLRAAELLGGGTVTVEADPMMTDRDKFGRYYRHIRLPDGRLLGAVLVEEGYAFEYMYFTPSQYQAEYRQLEQNARAEGRGLWAASTCNGMGERADRVVMDFVLPMPAHVVSAQVVHIRDGDTVEVDIDGRIEPIRLVGIDTPETGRCYADAATVRITELIGNQTVWLEADPTQGDRDRYNRLLRFIWMSDGRMVNAIMVQEGFAYEYTYSSLYPYEPIFMQLEHEAHYNGRGLWSPTTCNGVAGRRWSNAYQDN